MVLYGFVLHAEVTVVVVALWVLGELSRLSHLVKLRVISEPDALRLGEACPP
jgi:hypothetical protein